MFIKKKKKLQKVNVKSFFKNEIYNTVPLREFPLNFITVSLDRDYRFVLYFINYTNTTYIQNLQDTYTAQ